MFCTTGNILMKYKTRDLQKISGIIQAIPVSGFIFLIGGLALIGSPPFNIFLSKFGILSAGFRSGYLWLMVACLLLLAIIFAGFIRMFSSSILGSKPEKVSTGEFNWSILAPLVVLVIFILVLGLYLPPQLELILEKASTIAVIEPSLDINSNILFPENTFFPVMQVNPNSP
jgi:hydrogenase-4 component F